MKMKLRCEELESRLVLAAYRWDPITLTETNNWSTTTDVGIGVVSNWLVQDPMDGSWDRSSQIPGPMDTVVFMAGAENCIVDISTIAKKVEVHPGYDNTIRLDRDLKIIGTNDDKPESASVMLSEATIQGNGGQFILRPGTRFHWWNGTFKNVVVSIDRSETAGAELRVRDDGSPTQRRMDNAQFRVAGTLYWENGSVATAGASELAIQSGGEFRIGLSGASTWSNNPANLAVVNYGHLNVLATSQTASLVADYTAIDGRTTVTKAVLKIGGTAEQIGASVFSLLNGGTFVAENTASTLAIRNGVLQGTGTVQGNLVLGYAAQDNMPLTKPILSPGGGIDIGVINVTGNFHMFSGQLDIEVVGMSENQFDRVTVSGYAAFTAGPVGAARDLVINLLPVHWAFVPLPPLWQFPILPFLTYGQPRQGDFANKYYNADVFILGTSEGPNDSPKKYWVQPKTALPATNGNIRGMAWRDNGAVPGVFEPGVETLLAGHGVRLFDGTGTFQLMYTTTDASGSYAFDGYDPGYYVVRFDRPTGQRFAPQDVGLNDALDSDVDSTGSVSVSLFQDHLYTSAGLYANSPPVVPPVVLPPVYRNKPISGDLSTGVTDPDGDNPKFRVGTGPSHGTITIDPKGRFTYTPAADYTGSDSFTFVADDGYDGVTTANVTVTVLPGATIAGRIWNDANRNGTQDPGEAGLSGVLVQLFDANLNVVAVTITDEFGNYWFVDVPAGQFRLRVTAPSNGTFAPPNTGDDEDFDSDFDEFGYGDIITTTSGGAYDFDAGLWFPPAA